MGVKKCWQKICYESPKYILQVKENTNQADKGQSFFGNENMQNKWEKNYSWTGLVPRLHWWWCYSMHDEWFRVLRKLRGSPPYWESAKNDVFAMIKQLGVPNGFYSFLAGD